jgi:hypothetical protein
VQKRRISTPWTDIFPPGQVHKKKWTSPGRGIHPFMPATPFPGPLSSVYHRYYSSPAPASVVLSCLISPPSFQSIHVGTITMPHSPLLSPNELHLEFTVMRYNMISTTHNSQNQQ